MATKWEVLIERRDALKLELELAEHRLNGLENTPCGLTCSGCGKYLETEADFAKHFVLQDVRFLNLGECPEKK